MRVSARPPLARIQAIDSSVRRREWPNSRSLAKKLEVTSRTIQRDIEFMRCRLGAPIEFDSRRNGFWYPEDSYQLPFFQLSEGELVALLVASQVMKQYRGTPFEKNVRRVLDKIAQAFPERIELSLDDLSHSLSVLPRVQTAYDPQVFSVLWRAVRRSRQVRLVYWTAGRNATSEREVDPYDLMLASDDDWCLLAFCHLRGAMRTFKVQRIRSVEETGESFTRPAGFHAREYMANTFGTIRGDGAYDVVLRFTAAYAGRIAEKEWRPGQVLDPQPDGTLILKLHVNDLREIERWVMFWGAECEVLEPDELKRMVANELKAIDRLYH